MAKDLNNLFTVGCSTHSSESIIDILKKNTINAVADVRSNPYKADILRSLMQNN